MRHIWWEAEHLTENVLQRFLWKGPSKAMIISAASAASFLPPLLDSGAQDSFPSLQVAAQTTDIFKISFFFFSEVFPPFKDSRMFPYCLSLRNIFNWLNLASYCSSYTGPFNWFLSSLEFGETQTLTCVVCQHVRTTLLRSILTFLALL